MFVNFPYDNEIWTILSEKGVQPDDVIVLQDTSSQLEALQKRWYKTNRTEIDRDIRERKEREANEQRIREEEEKWDRFERKWDHHTPSEMFSCRRRQEEIKLNAERAHNAREEERQRRIEAGEPPDDDDEEGENGEKDLRAFPYLSLTHDFCHPLEMAQKILDDQKYEPKKEDFIDKIPETIPEGNVNSP